MPTIENVWSNAPFSGLNTFPISVGAITEGNLIVAPVTSDQGSRPDTHPFDDVLFSDFNEGFSSFTTCYKIATGSEPGSYSWYDATTTHWAGSVIEISGTNGTIESYANNEAYGNLPISLSVTPTVNGSMIITVISLDNDIATTTMNAAFTQIAEADTGSIGSNGAKQLVGYYIQETAGPTGNFSHGTLSVTGAWQTSTIVIAPTDSSVIPTAMNHYMNMMRG